MVGLLRADPLAAWVRHGLVDLRAASLRSYRNSARFFLEALARHRFASGADDAHLAVANALADFVERGNSAATIRHRCEVMRRLWSWLNEVAPGTVHERCFAALKVPRGARGRPPIRTLNIEQQAALLSAARAWASPCWPPMHLYTFVALGLLMALRPHELVHLDWRELHLSAPRPFLRLEELPARGVKNALARQALTLPPGIAPLFDSFFSCEDSGPIFPVASRNSHRPALRAVGRLAGFAGLNLYALRRTCITNWHRQGIELQRLTILSRHANPVILNRHYLERPDLADIETGLPV